MENKNIQVTTKSGFSLWPVGIIVWIVFMIMGYGCHDIGFAFGDILYANQFWIWFPLWIVPAFWAALFVIVIIIGVIATIFDRG